MSKSHNKHMGEVVKNLDSLVSCKIWNEQNRRHGIATLSFINGIVRDYKFRKDGLSDQIASHMGGCLPPHLTNEEFIKNNKRWANGQLWGSCEWHIYGGVIGKIVNKICTKLETPTDIRDIISSFKQEHLTCEFDFTLSDEGKATRFYRIHTIGGCDDAQCCDFISNNYHNIIMGGVELIEDEIPSSAYVKLICGNISNYYVDYKGKIV